MIIVAGLLVTRIGQGWGRLGLVFLDWLPFTLVLILYDRSRGLAVSVGMPLHEADAVHWEKWFCGGVVPTVWLRDRAQWVRFVSRVIVLSLAGFSLVYLGEHYVIDIVAGVCYAVAAHLALLRWERYRADRNLLTALSAGEMSDLGLVNTEVTGVEAGVSGTEMAR